MMRDRRLASLLMMLFAVFAMALAGCNTTAGVGKDISGAGGALSNAARPAQPAQPAQPDNGYTGK